MGTSATVSPTLIDVLRREPRARHTSLRTENTNVYRARDFICFHSRHQVAAPTHNQVLSALLFEYDLLSRWPRRTGMWIGTASR